MVIKQTIIRLSNSDANKVLSLFRQMGYVPKKLDFESENIIINEICDLKFE